MTVKTDNIHTFSLLKTRENIAQLSALVKHNFIRVSDSKIYMTEPVLARVLKTFHDCRCQDSCATLSKISDSFSRTSAKKLAAKLSTFSFNIPNVINVGQRTFDVFYKDISESLSGVGYIDDENRSLKIGVYSNVPVLIDHYRLKFDWFFSDKQFVAENVDNINAHEFMNNDANLIIVFDYKFSYATLRMFEYAAKSSRPVVIASNSASCIYGGFLDSWGKTALVNYERVVRPLIGDVPYDERMTDLGLSLAKTSLVLSVTDYHRMPYALFTKDTDEAVKFAKRFLTELHHEDDIVVFSSTHGSRFMIRLGERNTMRIPDNDGKVKNYLERVQAKIGDKPFIIVVKPSSDQLSLQYHNYFQSPKVFIIFDCSDLSKEDANRLLKRMNVNTL